MICLTDWPIVVHFVVLSFLCHIFGPTIVGAFLWYCWLFVSIVLLQFDSQSPSLCSNDSFSYLIFFLNSFDLFPFISFIGCTKWLSLFVWVFFAFFFLLCVFFVVLFFSLIISSSIVMSFFLFFDFHVLVVSFLLPLLICCLYLFSCCLYIFSFWLLYWLLFVLSSSVSISRSLLLWKRLWLIIICNVVCVVSVNHT